MRRHDADTLMSRRHTMQETRHIEEWVQAWTDIQQRMWTPWIRAAQYTGQLPRMEAGGWDVRTALAAYGRVVNPAWKPSAPGPASGSGAWGRTSRRPR